MLPGFTAEIALGRHRTYTTPPRDAAPAAAEIRPQQRALAEGPDNADAPVQMCTCPCCITYKGRLVCC